MQKVLMSKAIKERCKRLYQEHKSQVVVGRKSTRELLACIQYFIDLEESSIEQFFSPFYLECLVQQNKEYLDQREEWNRLSPDFVVYQVKRNEKSEKYYKSHTGWSDLGIFLLVERHTTNFDCNSFELGNKIKILRGVDQKDIDTCSYLFVDYMLAFLRPEDW